MPFMRQPFLMLLLNYAYASLAYQVPLFLAVAFLLGYARAGSEFVLAWSITLSVCVAIFPFVPALGGYLHYQLEHTQFPEIRILASWLFVPPFHALRDGSMTTVELSALDGIVTFPSFHVAAAVLLAWAGANLPLLRYPMIVLNILMLLSAIPIGGHYLIDVIAGCLVAVGSIIAARALGGAMPRRLGLRPVQAEL
jgi:membrane-associated phospholipid phosphatase